MPAGKPKGYPKPKGSGRQPGQQNKFTLSVKEGVLAAFQAANADPKHPANLNNFAKSSPKEFNLIAAKLIPTEVNATISEVKLSVNRKSNG